MDKDIIFEVIDKTGRKIILKKKGWKHIKKHPNMDENRLDEIKNIIKNPPIIRYSEDDEEVVYFYKEYKEMSPEERYLFISVKYLNGEGFVITSFFTNRITGLK